MRTSITSVGIDVIYMDMRVFVCVLGCSVRQERKGEETHLNLVKKAVAVAMALVMSRR